MKKELFAGALLLVLIGWVFFFSSSPAGTTPRTMPTVCSRTRAQTP